MQNQAGERKPGLEIFRFADAVDLEASGIMGHKPLTQVQQEGVSELVEAGYGEGARSLVLVNMPGFSLVHVWFKSHFPLLLHSHDEDCLYYVIAGSLQLGRETLEAGDGFFIRANVPYSYTAGPRGVEVLEIRHASAFDFVNHSRDVGFYRRAAQTAARNYERWKGMAPPSEQADPQTATTMGEGLSE